MQNRLMQQLKFNRWHERQLFLSFAWLLSCLMCGFLFVAIIEFVGVNFSGIFSILSILVLYPAEPMAPSRFASEHGPFTRAARNAITNG
jgi:hypothetical protein